MCRFKTLRGKSKKFFLCLLLYLLILVSFVPSFMSKLPYVMFSLPWRTPPSISYRAILLAIHVLFINFLTGSFFAFWVKNRFACSLPFFQHLTPSCDRLISTLSTEKSHTNCIVPLCVRPRFPLDAFKIFFFSFSLSFNTLPVLFLGFISLVFILV